MGWYRRFGKRAVDVVGASAALVLLAPLLAATAVLIKLEDRGPVLFRQTRVGRGGDPFPFLKFRSMAIGTPNLASADARGLRVTRVGRWIRRTNIDELPQLVNVLRGEMSLVGPRPALPSQTALVELRSRGGALDCLPGLTGLAQVSAYDGMPETEKAAFDGEYARTVSLRRDAGIVLRTFRYLTQPPPVY